MRALVVYESMYGNTHVVADHIAEGLRRDYEVEVVPVVQATKERVAAADLVVVGGPTHAHGMSSRQSRKAAVDATKVKVGGLEVDPDATGEGLRDWFHEIGQCTGAAAAFDTRFDMARALTGHASGGIARRLRRAGFDVITDPTSFFVTKQEHLVDGEAERATEWGTSLALMTHYAPSS
jgi:flavodoxin